MYNNTMYNNTDPPWEYGDPYHEVPLHDYLYDMPYLIDARIIPPM